MTEYSKEIRYILHNTENGNRLEVGDNPDFDELTQVVSIDSDGKTHLSEMSFDDKELEFLIDAFQKRLNRKQ